MMGARSMPCLSMVLRLIMVVCCISLVVAPAQSVTNAGDVNILHKLQQAWGEGTLLWSTGTSDPCLDAWTGVICNTDNTRVTSLYLVNRGLVGNIPPELGSLSALANLDLSFNSLTGQLPTELGSLTSLVYLSVQSCQLSGPIPASLGKLGNLTFFALNGNQLNGPIPSSLGAIKGLKWFDVSYNNLSGPLPVSTSSPDELGLDTLPAIEDFRLNDNAFSGPIPPELGLATNCIHMLFEDNSFSGSIPESFGNLSSLQVLNLNNNLLTGSIPITLNKIIGVGTTYAGLQQIRVANNQLSGTVPNFSALNQLEYVDFSNNSFDPQPFPAWLNASSSTLQTIRFDNGNLIGPLPADVLSYPALQGLLQGNPICTGTGLTTANPAVCNSTQNPIATQWTSPLAIANPCQVCKDSRLTLNPYTCLCSVPLIITLQVQSPSLTKIDDETLWESFQGQTYDSLSNLSTQNNPPVELASSQIWVHDASYNGSLLRPQVTMFFFPLANDNESALDQTAADFIKRMFTSQRIKYFRPFGPGLVIDIIFLLIGPNFSSISPPPHTQAGHSCRDFGKCWIFGFNILLLLLCIG